MDQFLKLLAQEKDQNSVELLVQNYSSTLASFTAGGKDPLEILDPINNSNAFLAVLLARLHANREDPLHLFKKLNELARGMKPTASAFTNAQLEELGKLLVGYSQSFPQVISIGADMCVSYGSLLGQLELTRLHRYVLEMILSALPRMSVDVNDRFFMVDNYSKSYGISSRDFLLYQYYGGLVLLKRRRLRLAADWFERTLYIPGTVASAIQVEALKKLVLVKKILGSHFELPTHVGIVAGALKQHTSTYLKFTKILESGNVNRAEQTLQEHTQEFWTDGNYHLAQKCLEALLCYKIKKLEKVYKVISLQKIEALVGGGLEPLIQSMINNGMIKGQITNGNLEFLSERTTNELHLLQREHHAVQSLNKSISYVERELATSMQYMTHASIKSGADSPSLELQ